MSVSTSVYRVYGIGWELLYVGCTKHINRRMQEHKAGSKWYHRMVHLRVRVYPSRERALSVEDRAIRVLKPTYDGLSPGRRITVRRRNRAAWEKAAQGKGELADMAKQALAMKNCPKE